jgi:hypothetical protein
MLPPPLLLGTPSSSSSSSSAVRRQRPRLAADPCGVEPLVLLLLPLAVPKRRGKRIPRGCLSTGRQALTMPRLASMRVQMPRSMKL